MFSQKTDPIALDSHRMLRITPLPATTRPELATTIDVWRFWLSETTRPELATTVVTVLMRFLQKLSGKYG
ncbi:hypothetical protein L1987_48465 [Smallanthus sonchifolius]|uniref:Uncharacterized protein n=2 Tax=Smallanthus sonchifolius TaxID=185202 RepID=A0ACB9FS24_9ASTR|nr:hypothetical protein L1987_48464 [Smallanthus sonchifolius]KAI3773926.1 hypothetical protein L1987_48465 [Smallanthus sonchifolius]